VNWGEWAKLLPLTLGSFGLVSLGMIGMLPLSGFWSKYYLLQGSLNTGSWPILAILLVSGLLNAFYFIPITISAFTGKAEINEVTKGSSFVLMLVPTLILTVLALVFGLLPGLTLPLVNGVIGQFFSL